MIIWLTLGANAFIGIYNIMGGTGYLRGAIAACRCRRSASSW